MVAAAGRAEGTDRIMDLERTVEMLNGQVREMQWERQSVHSASRSVRWWRNLVLQRDDVFMSAVCNRRVRPNMKVVSHAGPRA